MILVDTGPLVALCDARDELHGRAVEDLQNFVQRPFGTCEAVVTEAAFHLPESAQRYRLRALLDELEISFVPVAADPRTRARVWEWLLSYAEHTPDWADGCLAVLSGMNPGVSLWTYDREFRTIWRKPDGSPVPLAVT